MAVAQGSWYYRCISTKVPWRSGPGPTLFNVINMEKNYTAVKISGDME